MKKFMLFALALTCLSFFGCNPPQPAEKKVIKKEDTVVYSFSFLGCNRIDWDDVVDSIPSTANKGVLERIFKEMMLEERQPELFFFLGDLVLERSHLSSEKEKHTQTHMHNRLGRGALNWCAKFRGHSLKTGMDIWVFVRLDAIITASARNYLISVQIRFQALNIT